MSLDLSPAGRTRLVDALARIAREAGAAIMAVYDAPIAVRTKDDASPVTEADEAAERIIVAALERLTPEIAIVAEERMSRGEAPTLDDRPFWLVDPLDGTKEFINRSTDFTVNIALVVNGAPALGVVYLPARDRLYAGIGRNRAFVETTEGRGALFARTPPAAGLTVVASRSHNNPETQAYVAQFKVAGYAEAGSSLKFCTIAEGAADLYPRLGRTMEWDTAAGHAILACAGGCVTTLEGTPLAYGKAGFVNPIDVARGRA